MKWVWMSVWPALIGTALLLLLHGHATWAAFAAGPSVIPLHFTAACAWRGLIQGPQRREGPPEPESNETRDKLIALAFLAVFVALAVMSANGIIAEEWPIKFVGLLGIVCWGAIQAVGIWSIATALIYRWRGRVVPAE
jgi:hypothetical protein